MQCRINPTVRVLALAIAIFGAGGLAAQPAAAQSVPCVNEPFLGNFDGDGDGVLTVGEVRSAAPDNEQIQEVANQMEAAGLSGIRYTDCEESGGASGDEGGGSSDVPEDESDEDTSTGEQPDDGEGEATATAETDAEAGDDDAFVDERLTVTTLPAVGDGTSGDAGLPINLFLMGWLGITLLCASAAARCQRFA